MAADGPGAGASGAGSGAEPSHPSSPAWTSDAIRKRSFLLRGQNVVLVGYGAIARRLAELLTPLTSHVVGVRRRPRGDEGIRMVATADLGAALAVADHVVDLLPHSAETERFFDAARLGQMKAGAFFYNIGRGKTVDQPALIAALQSGRLAAAYLDVTDPEPLPPEHPLWRAPNCFITPHSAGGHAHEGARLVEHFLANLGALSGERTWGMRWGEGRWRCCRAITRGRRERARYGFVDGRQGGTRWEIHMQPGGRRAGRARREVGAGEVRNGHSGANGCD